MQVPMQIIHGSHSDVDAQWFSFNVARNDSTTVNLPISYNIRYMISSIPQFGGCLNPYIIESKLNYVKFGFVSSSNMGATDYMENVILIGN